MVRPSTRSTTRSFSLLPYPSNWTVVGIGDFNGDGNSDILLRDNSGNLAVWYIYGHIVLPQSTGLGNIPTTFTVAGTGDFNNDGRSDILWRDSSGNLSIWLMGGGGDSSNNQPPQILGTPSLGFVPLTFAVAATGDYNFDGFSDILWRDTAGNVSIWFMPVPRTPPRFFRLGMWAPSIPRSGRSRASMPTDRHAD